jgi:hypothetical protein
VRAGRCFGADAGTDWPARSASINWSMCRATSLTSVPMR